MEGRRGGLSWTPSHTARHCDQCTSDSILGLMDFPRLVGDPLRSTQNVLAQNVGSFGAPVWPSCWDRRDQYYVVVLLVQVIRKGRGN